MPSFLHAVPMVIPIVTFVFVFAHDPISSAVKKEHYRYSEKYNLLIYSLSAFSSLFTIDKKTSIEMAI